MLQKNEYELEYFSKLEFRGWLPHAPIIQEKMGLLETAYITNLKDKKWTINN